MITGPPPKFNGTRDNLPRAVASYQGICDYGRASEVG